jgi:2-methylcitrate dehydratase PrpD
VSAPGALERVLANYVANGTFQKLPRPAIQLAKAAIRDCVGAIVAGAGEPAARIVADQVTADCATGSSTILTRSIATSPSGAALANGTAAARHCVSLLT